MRVILAIFILLTASLAQADTLAWAQERFVAKDFDAFFGAVQWTRVREWPRLSAEQKDRWYALELVALARLCAWPAIDARVSAEEFPGPLSREAMSHIQLKSGFKRYKRDPDNRKPSLLKRLEINRSRWAASTEDFSRFSSPENLRVHVGSRCEL